jgi:hypothetical protein
MSITHIIAWQNILAIHKHEITETVFIIHIIAMCRHDTFSFP